MSVMFSKNSSSNGIVRPAFFFISGFSNIPHSNYYYIFLSFVYVVSMLGNSFVMIIIYRDRNLHTPKYMAIFNLAIADVCQSTALIPNLIKTFLFDSQEITYVACLANLFFVFFFICMQSTTLVILAYDRFVAICIQLRYYAVVTNISMGVLITVTWTFNSAVMSFTVGLHTRFSFCKSTVIDSLFCDYGPVYRLACNDYSPNIMMAYLNIATFIFLPLTLIGLSYTVCVYTGILVALFKITSWEGRLKALQTCFSHFTLVSIFYIPVVCTYITAMTVSIHRNARIINTSLSYSLPPMINPIVYSLNTVEIKEFAKKMFRANRLKRIAPALEE
ncbi:olfactory receptor 1-like [Scleropages formosus]|uniref:olfactory receptor 1-like n=1 Tax=Scleropages formosus TaxID=113540 RepID=UPI0010FAA682|nr:olfactory receptor 1-like [Scleropages formosus]